MEWGIREFFLGLGVVGVVALLAHGLWTRFRDELPLRMDRSLGDDGEEIDLTRSELPNGGARVVSPGPLARQQSPPSPATIPFRGWRPRRKIRSSRRRRALPSPNPNLNSRRPLRPATLSLRP